MMTFLAGELEFFRDHYLGPEESFPLSCGYFARKQPREKLIVANLNLRRRPGGALDEHQPADVEEKFVSRL